MHLYEIHVCNNLNYSTLYFVYEFKSYFDRIFCLLVLYFDYWSISITRKMLNDYHFEQKHQYCSVAGYTYIYAARVSSAVQKQSVELMFLALRKSSVFLPHRIPQPPYSFHPFKKNIAFEFELYYQVMGGLFTE